jgi:hypothetical protein
MLEQYIMLCLGIEPAGPNPSLIARDGNRQKRRICAVASASCLAPLAAPAEILLLISRRGVIMLFLKVMSLQGLITVLLGLLILSVLLVLLVLLVPGLWCSIHPGVRGVQHWA